MSLLGAPYGFGASGPERFDCSGFTQYVLGLHGRALPREVADQFHVGLLVEGAPEAGDLVFFAVEGAGPTHVGIAIGDGAFVHAPSSRGVVRVERLNTAYWRARYIGSRRVTATTPR